MIIQRRNFIVVRQLEEILATYTRTLDIHRLTPILNQLQETGHQFEPSKIDKLLKMYHSIHDTALEIYDLLYPSIQEGCQSSRERRLYILHMGII